MEEAKVTFTELMTAASALAVLRAGIHQPAEPVPEPFPKGIGVARLVNTSLGTVSALLDDDQGRTAWVESKALSPQLSSTD
ncbi:hypothetical protein E2C01_049605 [Portunus trituberculatus]|uniref:Uncharacterized protein n=1 Tax=Portunus trituberculatus TaxID=210409 RepID=A0A5B7GED1_PORTR|nr:hypothetical protein [Portunus trituberculatus]